MTKKLITREYKRLENIGYLKDLKAQIELILSQCEDDNPTYDIDYYESFGSRFVYFIVNYRSLETDEEYEARLHNEKRLAQIELERERKKYEALKAKFEGK